VSIVAVDAEAPGYVQALPCGTTPGSSSNLNIDAGGQTRAALAVMDFAADGTFCVFNQPRAHLVADLQGSFADGAIDDGADERVLDTRSGVEPGAGSRTPFHGRPGSTAIASVVVTETTGAGYVQVMPCGDPPGSASNLNADAAHETRSVLAFVRFDSTGTACVYTQRAAHLVVDIQAYLVSGAFDDIADTRILDTRLSGRPVAGSSTVVRGRPDSTAVVAITATETSAAGYLQVLPCGDAPGGSSNLNTDRSGQTIAGLAFVHFDATGSACVHNQQSTDIVVDVQGYMAPGAFVEVSDVRLLDTRIATAR
jgi:hypothetical protein